MRRALIAFGTLGGGTLIAFVLAGLAFLADPAGRLVPVTGAPVGLMGHGPVPQPLVLIDRAVPQPMPAVEDAVVRFGPAPAPDGIDEALKEELAREAGG